MGEHYEPWMPVAEAAYVALGGPSGPGATHIDLSVWQPHRQALYALPSIVRERMDSLGVSVREVGRQAGVSFSTVSRYVNGGNDPALSTVLLLMLWLDHTAQNAEQAAP